jgi:hypothetical protein
MARLVTQSWECLRKSWLGKMAAVVVPEEERTCLENEMALRLVGYRPEDW